ncbi:hypothetical protein FQZ97_965610 [compost metagenome]
MQRQRTRGPVLAGGRYLEAGAQQRTQRTAHLHQHAVVAGADEALVKAQVGRDVVAAEFDGALHAREGVFHLGNVFGGGALGGQRHRGGLDHAAQVLQVAQELGRQARLRLPDDDVGVEPVPLVGRLHARAHLRAAGHEALGDQRLDRFAHHGPAHAELFAQERLRRNRRAGRIAARDDVAADAVDRVAVNVLDHACLWVCGSGGVRCLFACPYRGRIQAAPACAGHSKTLNARQLVTLII